MLKSVLGCLLLVMTTAAQADTVASIRYLERDGKVEVSTTGAATAQTPFAIASIGKTMTAVAVLRLVARGELSLDEMAANRVSPEFAAGLGGLKGVTLRHLLTMTSGLPDYLTDDYIHDALDDPDNIQHPQTALTYVYGEEVLFLPAKGFDYSNTNYVLLGIILETATGQSYADLMQDLVLGPAGMTRSFVFGSRRLPADFPNGHEDGDHIRKYYEADGFGDGGVISTAHDLALFYKALLVDRSLLPANLMQEFGTDPLGADYGMGIEMEDGIWGHSGGDLGFASDVRMDIRSGDIAIILVADADADTDWTYDRLLD